MQNNASTSLRAVASAAANYVANAAVQAAAGATCAAADAAKYAVPEAIAEAIANVAEKTAEDAAANAEAKVDEKTKAENVLNRVAIAAANAVAHAASGTSAGGGVPAAVAVAAKNAAINVINTRTVKAAVNDAVNDAACVAGEFVSGVLDSQLDKTNGLMALNGLLMAIIAIDREFVSQPLLPFYLLVASCFCVIPIMLVLFQKKPEIYATPIDSLKEHIRLVAFRSICMNVAVILSYLALSIIAYQAYDKLNHPPKDYPKISQIQFISREVKGFCRGEEQLNPETHRKDDPHCQDVNLNSVYGEIVKVVKGTRIIQITAIGSADRIELTGSHKIHFGSNNGLARARGEWVVKSLKAQFEKEGISQEQIPVPVVLITGPKVLDDKTPYGTMADRAVTVTILYEASQAPKSIGGLAK